MIDPSVRDDGPEITDRLLRQFAGLWLAVFGALSLLQGVGRGHLVLASVLAALAVVPGLAGLARPRSVEPVFRVAMAAAIPIGWVVSHVLLAVIFYLVITPVAIFFRLIGRDALVRRPAPGAGTHWVAREPTTDPRRYWHQS
jgi:hypothetical protein